jgi:hypothetical protein
MASLWPIISGVIGALLTGVILSWASRSASSARTDGLLRYSGRMRAVAVGLLGIALFIGYGALHASPDQRLIAGVVGMTALTCGIWFVVEAFSFRGRVTETHLVVRSSWRGVREVPWEAVEGYSFSDLNQWHVLHTRGYGKVRLSVYLEGVDQVAEQLERQAEAG